MKMTVWEKTTEVEVDNYTLGDVDIERVLTLVRGGKIEKLLGDGRGITLQASGETLREATGEDILAFVQEQGGRVTAIERDEHGTIIAIQASGALETCEYDSQECAEVLQSLQASAALPNKITGDLAQTSQTIFYTATGATNSTTAVTLASPITGLATAAVASVTGPGIPAGTTAAINGTAVTLSQAATATAATVALQFGVETQVIGLGEWTIDWKRKTVEATTTDDAAFESSLGSTASWTVKSKYMFVVGDSSQANAVVAEISNPGPPKYWNFFPSVKVGLPAYSGYATIDGITITAGAGKLVGLDVSLKGTGPLYVGQQLAPVATTNTVTGQQAEV